jgi:hypothetical protein
MTADQEVGVPHQSSWLFVLHWGTTLSGRGALQKSSKRHRGLPQRSQQNPASVANRPGLRDTGLYVARRAGGRDRPRVRRCSQAFRAGTRRWAAHSRESSCQKTNCPASKSLLHRASVPRRTRIAPGSSSSPARAYGHPKATSPSGFRATGIIGALRLHGTATGIGDMDSF